MSDRYFVNVNHDMKVVEIRDRERFIYEPDKAIFATFNAHWPRAKEASEYLVKRMNFMWDEDVAGVAERAFPTATAQINYLEHRIEAVIRGGEEHIAKLQRRCADLQQARATLEHRVNNLECVVIKTSPKMPRASKVRK